jgi:hypothetical protein
MYEQEVKPDHGFILYSYYNPKTLFVNNKIPMTECQQIPWKTSFMIPSRACEGQRILLIGFVELRNCRSVGVPVILLEVFWKKA